MVLKRQTEDTTFNQFQDDVITQLQGLPTGAIGHGTLHADLSVSATAIVVNTGMKRIQGWIKVGDDSGVTLSGTTSGGTLTLTASGPAVVSIWVF